MTSKQEIIAVTTIGRRARQPETGAKISKCSSHFFSPQKSPQNSRPRVPFNDLRCRPCVPSHCKYVTVQPWKGWRRRFNSVPGHHISKQL